MVDQGYHFQQGQKVEFDYQKTKATGTIISQGNSAFTLPLLGTMWIIKLDKPLPYYPLDTIYVWSNFMTPLDPPQHIVC